MYMGAEGNAEVLSPVVAGRNRAGGREGGREGGRRVSDRFGLRIKGKIALLLKI